MTAPVNDNIANAITLTPGAGTLGPYIIDDATTEGGELDHSGSSNKSIWFKFTASANASGVHFSTFGSLAGDAPSGDGLAYGAFGSLDTSMAVYTGSTPTTSNSNNDDSAFDPEGGYWSELTLGIVSGTTYWIQVGVIDPSYVGTVILRWQNIPGSTYPDTVLADSPAGYWRLGDPHGPRALDVSSGNHHGTYTNAPTQDVSPLIGGSNDQAVSFDGSNDYVDITNSSAFRVTTAFTLEAWVKVASGETEGGVIMSNKFNTTIRWALGFFDASSNMTLKPAVGFYDGAWRVAQSASSITANTVHHIVGTWDGTNLKVYVDGSQVVSSAPGVSVPTGNTDTNYIASRWDNTGVGQKFKGVLDEVAIYPADIGATRIAAHYTAGSGTTDGTATPSTTAGTGAVPAVTATATGFSAPSTTAGVGAVPGATAQGGGGSTAFPATTNGIGAVPAASALSSSAASPARVAGVGAVPAPTAQGRSTAPAPRVAGTGAVPVPVLPQSPHALPSNVIGIGRVPRTLGFGQGTGGGGGSSDGSTDFWAIKALG